MMKTIMEFDELRVPDCALPYLVNGDESGLDSTDLEAIKGWWKQFVDFAIERDAIAQFNAGHDEASFTWRPEFGKGCSCVFDCMVAILKEES